MKVIRVDDLKSFCSSNEIFQSSLDGQLIVKIGETNRGDDKYELLIDHIPIVSVKESEWIPVSERLPEDYTDVIATVEEHYKDEIGYFVFPQARYSREYGWEWPYEAGTDYWTGLNGVVAWMPLPEPYKASPTGAEKE